MHSIRENLYYLWKKAGEKQRRAHFLSEFYEIDIERFNNCKEKKSQSQMRHEQKILQKYWGCKPLHYLYYDFYRKDCTVTIEEMKKYIPDYFTFNLFYPRSFKDYGILCEDKGLTYATLKGYDLSQPKMLFRFDYDRFYDESNGLIASSKVDELINLCKAEKLFVKPSFGNGGKGILVFNKKDNHYYNEDNVKLERAFLEKEVNDGLYIVQEGVVQHQELNKIYSPSVNTFRLFTECINGDARLMFSLLRMGVGGGQIDNVCKGGVYVRIDPDTGVFSDFGYDISHVKFYTHPETKFIYKDAKIENWKEIKDFIVVAAQKFRNIKYLGWDVAYSVNGPVIIEINNGPGIDIMQDHYGGLRDLFNINPKEWWFNSKFTIREL